MHFKKKQGLSTLIAILVIGSIALTMTLMTSLKSIDESNTTFHQQKTLQTFSGAEACLEEGLLKLHTDKNYRGENLTIEEVSCTIDVTGNGTTRTLTVDAHHSTMYHETVSVDIDWSDGWTVSNWHEVTPQTQ